MFKYPCTLYKPIRVTLVISFLFQFRICVTKTLLLAIHTSK